MASQSEVRLSGPQEELCQAFLDRALARLGENLQLLLGLDPGLSVESLGVENDARTRTALFPNAAAFPLVLDDAVEHPLHFLVEPVAALTMLALSRLAAPEEVRGIREAPRALDPDDRQGLREVSEFIAAAFTDEARAARDEAMTFQSARPVLLVGSQWETGQDPIAATPHLVVRGRLTLVDGEEEADPYVLLVPWDVLGLMVEGLVPPRDEARFPGQEEARSPVFEEVSAPKRPTTTSVYLLTPSGPHPACLELLPDAAQFRRPSDLLRALEDGGDPEFLVARVGPGDEQVLALFAALRHHPTVARAPALVLLDEPTRRLVMRCGELGLLDVLPTDAPLEVAAARVRALRARG